MGRSVMLDVKCSVGKEVEFSQKREILGVCFDTTEVKEGSVLISNKPSRVESIGDNMDGVLEAGVIKSVDVPTGRLQFAEHQLSSRIGKLALVELRQLEDLRSSVSNLDKDSRQELKLLQ